MLEWEKWWSATLPLSTWPMHTGSSTRTAQSNTWKEHIGMTRLLVQHLLYHSKGEMLRWEQENGHTKATRVWQKTYKVFSLNPLFQIEEDVWNTSFNKSWGMNNPVIYPQKVLSRVKNIKWHSSILHSGLTLNYAFSLGHGFSSIKVLPTPDKRARQRNKGMAENHTKSLVSNMSINLRKMLVRYHSTNPEE